MLACRLSQSSVPNGQQLCNSPSNRHRLGVGYLLRRSLTNTNPIEQFMIQTTAAMAPGSSGGPLLDSSGRVIGVTTSSFGDSPGIYFSIGAGDVKRLLRTPNLVSEPLAVWSQTEGAETK